MCVGEERLMLAGFCRGNRHPQVTGPAAEVHTFQQAYSEARHAESTVLPEPPFKPEYLVYYFHFELFPEKSFFQML